MSDTKIAFRQVGEGPVLVLLHGYAGSVLHWDPIVENLKAQYQLVIPNLTHLYMGQTRLTFTQQIENFAEFLKKNFPHRKVHVAGTSYGGALLWGLALKHPDLIDKTIFINPMPPSPVDAFNIPVLKSFFKFPLNPKSLYLVLKTPIGRFFIKRAAEVFRIERADLWDRLDGMSGRKLMFICHVIYCFAWMLKKENWNAWKMRLEVWTHPSLLIYDFHDPLFEPRTYLRFQELIGCDFLREIQDAGHIAVQTQPVQIAKMMNEFLSDVKGSTTAA